MPGILESSNLIYCPYTDRDIPKARSNTEHIIPKSLGGADELTIPVDKKFNSRLGSKLDRALANDFFVTLRRSQYEAPGHSGKEPWATSKKAEYGDNNRSAQVQIHRKHGMKLWDARYQELITNPGTVQFNTRLDTYLPILFAAKVALAAGYYVYGDQFRSQVDHHQLREIMRIGLDSLNDRDELNKLDQDCFTVRADDYLCAEPPTSDWRLRCIRDFCGKLKGSVILLIPSEQNLVISVGILGKYLAMINVPADTTTFPNENDYEWGQVLAVIDKKLVRCSWSEGLRQYTTTTKKK